jgi:hypothetical protein
MLVSRRYRNSAISELYILDGLKVIDLRKLLVERFPRSQELQKSRARHRLDDQTVPLFAEKSLVARKLKVSRNADGLVAAVSEQSDDSLWLHEPLPVAS